MTETATAPSKEQSASDGSGEGEGKTVPLEAHVSLRKDLNGKIGRLEREASRLAGQLDVLTKNTGTGGGGDKRYSREQLKAGVAEGKISQARMDDMLDGYRNEDARSVAREEVSAGEQTKRIDSQMQDYKALEPKAFADGSDERGRVQEAFDELVADGQPSNRATELGALKQVFGRVEDLRAAKAGKTRESGDDWPETGGGDGGPSRGGSGGDGSPAIWRKMSKESRDGFDQSITSGMYKDRAHVCAALEKSSPKARARHGLQ